ncbi:MAG: sulfatase-like hydrolase/transferase [Planctomycetes bacterium]|nr:sulfatase-like hydrolase/transferase [Planctomycetota bacterium]
MDASGAAGLRAISLAAAMHCAERPNIVIVLADDLGSCGQQLIQTPHLDRLAAQGMRCTPVYSGTSV